MKLHLPKLLFAAIVAFGACAQQAQAAAATKVQEVTIGEKTYKTTMVYGNNNVNISAADLALQEGTDYLGFSMYSDQAANASSGGSNHWASTNQTISSNIVIYDDNTTTEKVEGLVIDNGYATTTTFTGAVYGNGTISKITAAPSSGETFVFTGDMSNYSGDIKMIGKNTNKLRIEGSSTGTGTIESAGTVTLKNTAIRTSKITASTLNIEGAQTTVNSALTLSATTLNLSKRLDVSAAGASVNFATKSTVNINLIDLLTGNFGDVVKYNTTASDVQGNGYFRVEGLQVASDTSKVSGGQIKVRVGSHGGFDVNANSTMKATYKKLAYGIAADATYDSAIMGEAESLILDGTATLTLEASLPETVTKGIYIKGTGTKLNLANKDVVVNQGDFIILDGKKVALQGSGTYKIGTASIATGVSVDKLWTGTVEYSYSALDNALTENLSKLGNASSTVKLTGAGGHFATSSGGLKDLHLELKDNGEIKALTVSNGNSRSVHGDSASYLASTITGDGTLDYTFKGDTTNGSAISAFKLEGNISGWDGLFQYNASNASDKNELDLFVTGKATEVNVSIANKCAGKLNLIVENADKTTSLNAAVTVNTLKATDNSSIEVGGVIITDSLTLGAGSTLIFNGGNLTLSESLTLSIAQIKLAEDIVFNTADTYTLISMATDARSATGAITFTDDVANWGGAVYNIGGVDYAASLQNTGTALSVHFQAIPEPTTATLSLLALAGLAARRRRK